jgi:hypothetical protein
MHRAPRTCHPMGLAREVRLGVLVSSVPPASPVRSAASLTVRADSPQPSQRRAVELMIMASPASAVAGGRTPELA